MFMAGFEYSSFKILPGNANIVSNLSYSEIIA